MQIYMDTTTTYTFYIYSIYYTHPVYVVLTVLAHNTNTAKEAECVDIRQKSSFTVHHSSIQLKYNQQI